MLHTVPSYVATFGWFSHQLQIGWKTIEKLPKLYSIHLPPNCFTFTKVAN